jgi:hypothetical protein
VDDSWDKSHLKHLIVFLDDIGVARRVHLVEEVVGEWRKEKGGDWKAEKRSGKF